MELGPELSHCAESIINGGTFYGQRAIFKIRVKKAYRHVELDKKLREQRTLREARALVRCRRYGVRTPDVYHVDRAKCVIAMEQILGVTVRDFIKSCPTNAVLPNMLLRQMGCIVAMLHSGDMIHGDLTTSNFMLQDPENVQSLVLIDFGLVRQSTDAEERAVDLYVLERAISATHPLLQDPMSHVWAGYAACPSLPLIKIELTAKRLEQVRARGRKRSMVG